MGKAWFDLVFKFSVAGSLEFEACFEVLYPFLVYFIGFQRLDGASSFVSLGWIMYDFKFKRTENRHFTITTNTSQCVEFFHSLIFLWFVGDVKQERKHIRMSADFALPLIGNAPYMKRRLWVHFRLTWTDFALLLVWKAPLVFMFVCVAVGGQFPVQEEIFEKGVCVWTDFVLLFVGKVSLVCLMFLHEVNSLSKAFLSCREWTSPMAMQQIVKLFTLWEFLFSWSVAIYFRSEVTQKMVVDQSISVPADALQTHSNCVRCKVWITIQDKLT